MHTYGPAHRPTLSGRLLAPQFAVYALDTPGFGNSDPLPPGTTIEQLAVPARS